MTNPWYGYFWHDMRADCFTFLFLAITFVAAVPVVIRGHALHRFLAIGVLVLPVYLVIALLHWSFLLYGD